MKRAALVLFACLLATPGIFGQELAGDTSASKQDVQRLFAAMHTRELMASTMQLVAKQQHQMIHQFALKQPNLPPDFEAREDKQLDETLRNLPLNDLLDAMVPAYQTHFTKEDIDAFVAFYSSPAGQKLIKELPSVTADAMQASQGILQNMMAQAMQRVQEDAAAATQKPD